MVSYVNALRLLQYEAVPKCRAVLLHAHQSHTNYVRNGAATHNSHEGAQSVYAGAAITVSRIRNSHVREVVPDTCQLAEHHCISDTVKRSVFKMVPINSPSDLNTNNCVQ
jgi:hypothetical protein